MLRIDRKAKTFTQLDTLALPYAGLKERQDIQQMIANTPHALFSEMGEKLLLIGEEVRADDNVEDRIDLLAVDPEGQVVVLELKRSHHKLHLLQALSYASMVSKWSLDQLINQHATLTQKTESEALEDLERFLDEEIETLNMNQRIVLIAEDYDYQVLVTAEWLNEQHGVDVRCYRLQLSVDQDAEYLTCTCIYPPPEVTEHARSRRKRETTPLKWSDWNEALEYIENKDMVEFFKSELESGTEQYLLKRLLRYRIEGKRRYFIAARKRHGYVWQRGRFIDDESYWENCLSSDADVKPVKNGEALRFFLSTKNDAIAFKKAVVEDLAHTEFFKTPPDSGEDVDE